MSDPTAEPDSQATLRRRAQQQLGAGTAPANRGWGLSVEALALLHRLASTPAQAADALVLLHELQVHQVELDLQQAQLEANEHELAHDLARYRALFEHAPAAHLLLDTGGRITQVNRAGAERLGAGGNEIIGRRLDEFLSADSRLPLAGLLRDVRRGVAKVSRTVRPRSGVTGSRRWQLAASALPGCDQIQILVLDSPGQPED